MDLSTHNDWLPLSPLLGKSNSAHAIFREYARRLSDAIEDDTGIKSQRSLGESVAMAPSGQIQQALRAALGVLMDLARQRWSIRVTGEGSVEVKRPEGERIDSLREKARIRQQELVKRDEQLREPATQRFVRRMESSVIYENQPVSVFSLFRDGPELAESLRSARTLPPHQRVEGLRAALDPYLQFVNDSATCEHTGLRLQDIWRYFRHTWSNQYTSTPGRRMAFLVRDRARTFHPVMGIGAIGSPIVQIRERDVWIGWDAGTFLESVAEASCAELVPWLKRILDRAINELFIEDFLEEQLLDRRDLKQPSFEVIARLKTHGTRQRSLHHRFVSSQEHKSWPEGNKRVWRQRALTHLYRSKRALSLSGLLRARRMLREFFGKRATNTSVRAFIRHREGRRTVRSILRKAKADRIGIAIADINVCGAVEPYSQILVGKLVSMLAASPEVIIAYRQRYVEQESEIASSMAGRPVIRPSHLVLLGTTSLYGVGSSQYNRLKMPAELLGGRPGEHLEYRQLGKSKSYGTSHFSATTVDALVTLVEQTSNGQRVNSIFGEGVSPKLRKVRDGLGVLGLRASELLQHGRQRIVYAVPLVRNVREFLLGLNEEPNHLFDLTDPKKGTAVIVDWWTRRWLSKRVMNDEILARLDEHSLVRPIRHGARVPLPRTSPEQGSFFDDIGD